eukprot:480815_1
MCSFVNIVFEVVQEHTEMLAVWLILFLLLCEPLTRTLVVWYYPDDCAEQQICFITLCLIGNFCCLAISWHSNAVKFMFLDKFHYVKNYYCKKNIKKAYKLDICIICQEIFNKNDNIYFIKCGHCYHGKC